MATPTVVGTWAAESSSTGQYITVQRPPNVTDTTTIVVFISSAFNADPDDYEAPNTEWERLAETPDWKATTTAPIGVVWIRTPKASLPPSTLGEFRHDYTEVTSAVALAINFVDGTDPKNAGIGLGTGWGMDTDNTDTLPAASIDTTATNTLLLSFFAVTPNTPGSDVFASAPGTSDGSVTTVSTGFQKQLVAWEALAASGATGTRTATFDDTSGLSGPPATYGQLALNGVEATGGAQTVNVGLVIEDEFPLAITVVQEGLTPAPAPTLATPTTQAQREEMLQASAVRYQLSRMEVLSESLAIERDDISDNVIACRIEHGSQRNIHRIIDVDLDIDLDWGRQRVKPYLTVEGGGYTDTLPLGVFCLTAPTLSGGVRPPRYSVQGYDLMYLIDQPLASAVSYPVGQPILAGVRDLLNLRGIQSDHIANTRAEDVLTQTHAWGVEQGFTYLQVINDLLAMVGYRPLHMDRDGFPESGPHPPASQRDVMWRYDAGAPTTTVYMSGREHVDDYTDRPNRWVFWINQTDVDTPPEEGNGLYTVDNISDGPSSQTARGGLVITKAEGIEASTQSDLVLNGDRIVAEDKLSSTTIRLTTSLNPYHGHQDIVEIIDRDLGIAGPHESMVWNMDVFARTMTHELRSIAGGIV